MPTLGERVLTDTKRPRVVDDCVHLVDEEVARRAGFSGLAIKAAYAVVKKIKPGFIRVVIDGLIDRWVDKLEPHFAQYQTNGGAPSFGAYIGARAGEVSESLLEVTDRQAEMSTNHTVKTAYSKLRPSARDEVRAALPALGKLIDRHLAS